jgi:hypothetical protein
MQRARDEHPHVTEGHMVRVADSDHRITSITARFIQRECPAMNSMEDDQVEGDKFSMLVIKVAAGTFPDSPNIPDCQ